MLKRPDVGEGSGLHSHFRVLADLQSYSALAVELQAHGHAVTIDTNQLMRCGGIGRKDHISGHAQGCMQRHRQA